MADTETLLFIETFEHTSAEETHMDEIRFSVPIRLRGIRFLGNKSEIPLADGSLFSGKTSPPSFHVAVYANDHSISDPKHYEKLDTVHYSDGECCSYNPAKRVVTDSILLRGSYSALSVAVLGESSIDLSSKATEASTSVPEVPSLCNPPAVADVAILDDSLAPDVAHLHEPQTVTVPKIVLQTQSVPQPPILHPPIHVAPVPPGPSGMSNILPPAPIPPSMLPPHPHLPFPPPLHQFDPSIPPPCPGGPPLPIPPFIPPYVPRGPSSQNMYSPPACPLTPQDPINTASGPPAPPGIQPQVPNRLPSPISPPPSHRSRSRRSRSRDRERQDSMRRRSARSPERRRPRRNSVSRSHKRPSRHPHSPSSVDDAEAAASTSTATSRSNEDRRKGSLLEEGAPGSVHTPKAVSEYTDSDELASAQAEIASNVSSEDFGYGLQPCEIDLSEISDDFLNPVADFFDPMSFEMQTLTNFRNPCLSDFQWDMNVNSPYFTPDDIPVEALRVIQGCNELIPDEHGMKDWLFFLETLNKDFIPGLTYICAMHESKDFVLDKLVSWTMLSLDWTSVYQLHQSRSPYLLRHLKAGIALSIMLSASSPEIAARLVNAGVQDRLLDLYFVSHMTAPIKLRILAALERTTFFSFGLAAFTRRNDSGSCPYERLLQSLEKRQTSRVVATSVSIVRKIQFYLDAVELQKTIKNLNAEEPMTIETSNRITSLIERLISLINNARYLISIPRRATLPLLRPFSLPTPQFDPQQSLFQLLQYSHVLEALIVLLSHTSSDNAGVLSRVYDCFSALLQSKKGLLFYACQPPTTTLLCRLLLRLGSTSGDEESVQPRFDLTLVYSLQSLKHVDDLITYNVNTPRDAITTVVDSPAALTALQSLYLLTLCRNRGAECVARVLTTDANIECLLPFLRVSNAEEHGGRTRKLASAGYASELLLLAIRQAGHAEFLIRYHSHLNTIAKQEMTSKMSEVAQWTEFLCQLPSFGCEAILPLVKHLESTVQDGITARIPKSLISALRILDHLMVDVDGLSENLKDTDSERPKQLKHLSAIVEFHHHDGLALVLQLLSKLADIQLHFWMQGLGLNSSRGRLLSSCIQPAISIVRAVISHTIHCVGAEFRDVTAVATIAKLYSVTCTMLPPCALKLPDIQRIRDDCIHTLLAYTQPVELGKEMVSGEVNGTTHKNRRSLWTMMISEILSFSLCAPYTFVGGLNLLTELLPLPLPVQTKQPLSDNDSSFIRASRLEWSLHLLPLTDSLASVISTLAPSTLPQLHQSLRRACIQLSDLAAPIALCVTKALLDAVFEFALPKSQHENDESIAGTRDVSLPASEDLSHVMAFLAFLQSHAPMKQALLSLLVADASRPADPSSSQTIPYDAFATVVLQVLDCKSSSRKHRSCQESVASLIMSLFDDEICLLDSSCAISEDELLANALPSSKLSERLCAALVRHVGAPQHGLGSVLPSLRALLMLTEHSFGIQSVKKALTAEPLALLSLLSRLHLEFSRDSSDCLSTLNTLLVFIRSLIAPPEQNDSRCELLSISFVRDQLSWRGRSVSDNAEHALLLAREKIESISEDSLRPLLDSIEELISLLSERRDAISDEESGATNRVELPPPLSLSSQFARRPLAVSCVDIPDADLDEKLSLSYWLPVVTLGMSDMDDDEVTKSTRTQADLELLSKLIPHFNLREELRLKLSSKKLGEPTKRKAKPAVIINTSKGEKRAAAAPLRGRTFAPSNIHDPFRNRAPNTSRPPSMHVDDFVHMQHPPPDRPPRPRQTSGPMKMNDAPHRRREDRGRRPDRGVGGPQFRDRGFSAMTDGRRRPESTDRKPGFQPQFSRGNGQTRHTFGGPAPYRRPHRPGYGDFRMGPGRNRSHRYMDRGGMPTRSHVMRR